MNGWKTAVDERTDLGQGQAYFIREQSGRQFTEERTPVGMTVFTFPAGQACFRASTHTAPMDRPPIFVVRGGDWRGNPQRRSRVHTRPELWVEDCAENLDKVTERIKRG